MGLNIIINCFDIFFKYKISKQLKIDYCIFAICAGGCGKSEHLQNQHS
jgi:hypothetical protein